MSEFLTKNEKRTYRWDLVASYMGLLDPVTQLWLYAEGRQSEMVVPRVERIRKERSDKIQRRESIISNG